MDTFIYIIRPRVVHPVLGNGEVSKKHFVLWCLWLGRFDHSMKWPRPETRFTPALSPLDPSSSSCLLERLDKACFPTQPNKTQNNQFLSEDFVVFTAGQVRLSFKSHAQIPQFYFHLAAKLMSQLSSFHWLFRQKLVLFFRWFEENRHGQIRNGQSNRIFTNGIWQKLATAVNQITKPKTDL